MKNLNTYIDRCIIDEYATHSYYDGYTLDIETLPQHEIDNFLAQLMQHDTAVRDFVRQKMQEMIDARFFHVESERLKDSGLTVVHLPNGDVQFVKAGATW